MGEADARRARIELIASRSLLLDDLRPAGGRGGSDPLKLYQRPPASEENEALGAVLEALERALRVVGDESELAAYDQAASEEARAVCRRLLDEKATEVARTAILLLQVHDSAGCLALMHALEESHRRCLWELMRVDDSLLEWAIELRETWNEVERARGELGGRFREWPL